MRSDFFLHNLSFRIVLVVYVVSSYLLYYYYYSSCGTRVIPALDFDDFFPRPLIGRSK